MDRPGHDMSCKSVDSSSHWKLIQEIQSKLFAEISNAGLACSVISQVVLVRLIMYLGS